MIDSKNWIWLAEKGLYFDGKLDKDTPNTWKPENADKKYYS